MLNQNIACSELNIKDDDTVLIFQELLLDAANAWLLLISEILWEPVLGDHEQQQHRP